MLDCICGGKPQYISGLGVDREDYSLCQSRAVKCPLCKRQVYILKDLGVKINEKEAKEQVIHSWNEMMKEKKERKEYLDDYKSDRRIK